MLARLSLEWPRGFQEVKVPRFRDNGTGRWQGCLWSGPEGSWKLRFPDFVTTAQDVGKVVSGVAQRIPGS